MMSELILPTQDADDIHGQRSPNCPDSQDVPPLLQQLHKSLQAALKATDGNESVVQQLCSVIATQDYDLRKKLSTEVVQSIPELNADLFGHSDIEAILKGVKILVKYGKHLLKTKKDPKWRSIQRSNKALVDKLTPLKGHGHVLVSLGYSEISPGSFEFPHSVDDPDLSKVSTITADLLILTEELKQYRDNIHVNRQRFEMSFSTRVHEESVIEEDDCCDVCGNLSRVKCVECSYYLCIECDEISHSASKMSHSRTPVNQKRNTSVGVSKVIPISEVPGCMTSPPTVSRHDLRFPMLSPTNPFRELMDTVKFPTTGLEKTADKLDEAPSQWREESQSDQGTQLKSEDRTAVQPPVELAGMSSRSAHIPDPQQTIQVKHQAPRFSLSDVEREQATPLGRIERFSSPSFIPSSRKLSLKTLEFAVSSRKLRLKLPTRFREEEVTEDKNIIAASREREQSLGSIDTDVQTIDSGSEEEPVPIFDDEWFDFTFRPRIQAQEFSANDEVFEKLQEEGYDLSDSFEAAEQSGGSIDKARSYFKECCVCFLPTTRNKLIGLAYCQCHICRECFVDHFTQLSQSTSCMYRYTCPGCDAPDLESFAQSEFQEYFGLLSVMVKEYVSESVNDLFQQKLVMWGLMEFENFRWCVNHGCQNGFLHEGRQLKVRCPHCCKYQCFNCNNPWRDQHDDISCEEFDAWKKANDPELQALGLAAHLKDNGISCPRCKKRYELARGGCMHFKCPLCQHQFCCGCSLPFANYPDCKLFRSCKDKGLHAHHPRDCFYHLRDRDIETLQKLLQIHGVDFTETDDAARTVEHEVCPVILMVASDDGMRERKCGEPLTGKTSLCEPHYKEYLVGLINQHKLDPAEVFTADQLRLTLERHEKPVPPKKRTETDVAYLQTLKEAVKGKLPLKDSN